jgi:hypothetical protein
MLGRFKLAMRIANDANSQGSASVDNAMRLLIDTER